MITNVLKAIVKIFYNPVRYSIFEFNWRKKNQHNFTSPVNVIFPIDKVKIGNYTYGPLEVYSWNHNDEELRIGHFCSIAKGVKFLLGGNHDADYISTFPFKYYFQNTEEATSKGSIIIDDDVWIGMDCMLLSGITIGRGCIIAAGSIVTKSFPPYSIIGGNPARFIKSRFDEEKVKKLMKINFEKLDEIFIKNNIDNLYNECLIDELAERLS
ncbi:MAG: CatB-related O-acetyltransferase [Chryseobacterium sp.]|nr:CatB-related O-acetyltransferase [Chryseobacterium sp.]